MRSDSAGYHHNFLEYMESGKSSFGKIEFAVSCDVIRSFRTAVMNTPKEAWSRVVIKDSDGHLIATNQEIAEICFVPETKNRSKNAPLFRYLVTREAISIQLEFSDTGRMMFSTSETAERFAPLRSPP